MKRLLLATAACLALSLPAMAQNSAQKPPDQSAQQQNPPANANTNQAQSQNNAQPQANGNQQQAQEIDPSSLNRQEIKQIQMNLNKQGFNAKHVDGIWGPETKDALRNFEQSKHLPGNGELNQQTLAALNVPMEGRAASEPNKGASAPTQKGLAGKAPPSGASSSGQGGSQRKY